MKILGAIICHDRKMDILREVVETVLKVKGLTSVEFFAFNTEKKCAKLAKRMGLKINTYPRPTIDHKKITCSHIILSTGMRETELAQLAWLRNAVLDYVVENDFDYLYFIDADILIPKDAVLRLLSLKCDMALGWHFHKRLPVLAASWLNMKRDNIDQFVSEKRVVDGRDGSFGGVLLNRDVCKNVRVELYNSDQAEDGIFYRKAREAGYSLKIDLGLNYPHIGTDWKPKALKFKEEKSKLWGVKNE